jgi:hypothetical protein
VVQLAWALYNLMIDAIVITDRVTEQRHTLRKLLQFNNIVERHIFSKLLMWLVKEIALLYGIWLLS